MLHVYQDNIIVFLIRLITYGYFWKELHSNIFRGFKNKPLETGDFDM